MTTVACFVSPHGFGHAARVCAVIDALVRRGRSLRFHIMTTVPPWFFSESLADCYSYHACPTDVGLVQVSPLEEDLEATLRALEAAPWRDAMNVEALARRLRELRCSLVVSDISPLGLLVARCAGLPSVLIENFTWDWIYKRIDGPPELASRCDELASIFSTANLRIQTRPVCQPLATAVGVEPVARTPRCSPAATRRRLGIPDGDSMVLASMGGVGWRYPPLEKLGGDAHVSVVVPGGADVESRRGQLVLLPFHSSYFHPDLVHAADVVIGKLGYSTVAETYRAGAAMAYVERPRFPESPVLAEFIDRHLVSARIEPNEFSAGNWMPVVEELLSRGKKAREVENGADHAAKIIIERFPELLGEV